MYVQMHIIPICCTDIRVTTTISVSRSTEQEVVG